MSAVITVKRVSGPAIGPWLDDVARPWAAVFRDGPYPYAGDFGFERE